MKRIVSFLMVAVLLVSIPHYSLAWGKVGHGIVAEIAFTLLDSNTKAAVQKCLGKTTIEEASTWMDDVRSDHKFDYMKTWHYVNIERGNQYEATKEENIINAIDKALSELEHKDNLSTEDAKKDLMMLFHLVGDLHMPLHVGYAEDKGGNAIQVKYLGHQANLHRVWDTEIIESEHISTNDCLLLLKNFTKSEITGLKQINVENWIHEPRSMLSNVYAFKDETIDQAYVDRNKKIVETQLLIAGIRLAAVLEKTFK